jgi:hypothetical protein
MTLSVYFVLRQGFKLGRCLFATFALLTSCEPPQAALSSPPGPSRRLESPAVSVAALTPLSRYRCASSELINLRSREELTSLAVPDAGPLVGTTEHGGVLASTDGGETWRKWSANPVHNVIAASQGDMWGLYSRRGIHEEDSAELFYSAQQGRAWKTLAVFPASRRRNRDQRVLDGLPDGWVRGRGDTAMLVVSAPPELILPVDGPHEWKRVALPCSPGAVRDAARDGQTSAVACASDSGGEVLGVTDDSGVSWSLSSSPA